MGRAAGWRAALASRSVSVPLGVGLATALLYFVGLGRIPLVDSSEGFHVAIAWEMATHGDWITPHFDGIRYFDKPPLLYWLTALGFRLFGPSEWSARVWTALAVVGVATLTARLGTRLGGPRVGLLAGLLVMVNPGVFLFGRFAKPDLLFVFFITLAFTGFVEAYLTGSRRALFVAYASLGAAAMAKDILGLLVPPVVFACFLVLTRERLAPSRWVSWAGVALMLGLTVPWHLAMEWGSPGFLRYLLVDNHVRNVAMLRVFPDEDVPLSALEFLGATALAFFPWSLALPWGLRLAFRTPREPGAGRVWLLLGLWAAGFLAVLALSPFKLPHYSLPAFPAMALLVAKVWDDVLARRAGAPSPRPILAVSLVVLSGLTLLSLLAWHGRVLVPSGTLSLVDLYSRNLEAQGQGAPFIPYAEMRPWLPLVGLIFGAGSVVLAASLALARAGTGLVALLLVTLAFLPVISRGLALLVEARSPRPLIQLLARAAGPDDVVVHEGALENTGSVVIALARPVRIVNGLRSNLAFGATFPDAQEAVWGVDRLRREWEGPRRVFLVSVVAPERSVVNELPADRACLLLEAGGRRLYSNRSVEIACAAPPGRPLAQLTLRRPERRARR